MMKENLLSIGGVMAGIASLFLSDLFAIAVALSAVLLGFFAARRRERFYTAGMLMGAVVMIFVNLQNLGILKSDAQTEIENVYNSLRLSNRAHAMLSAENGGTMTAVLEEALRSARKVDTELVDRLVPGFRNHFEEEYIEGFALLKESYSGADTGKKLQGAVFVDMWAIWNSENKDKLEKARQKKPSLAAFLF